MRRAERFVRSGRRKVHLSGPRAQRWAQQGIAYWRRVAPPAPDRALQLDDAPPCSCPACRVRGAAREGALVA